MAKTSKRHPFQRDWKRDLLITALISMLLAMSLLLYTFGLTSDFISKLFNAFLGIFILVAGTAFIIIPSVNWLFQWLTGRKPKHTASAPRKNVPRNLPRQRE